MFSTRFTLYAVCSFSFFFFFFFFNDTATTEIYTLSLHDALPICESQTGDRVLVGPRATATAARAAFVEGADIEVDVLQRERSEEHTSELQSRLHLVCRLLLEKKKKIILSPMTDCRTIAMCATYII